MGKIATKILASGDGWRVGDVVCNSGPEDRPFKEQHSEVSIAVVVEGSFQYCAASGSEIMSPGALMLGNSGECFECRHEYGVGDRCVAFHYDEEFFERARVAMNFPVHRIPPIADLTPWVVEARLALHSPERVNFEELAHGLAGAVLGVLRTNGKRDRISTAADERRVSTTLRFIEANLGEPLPLERLARTAKMSEFHFLRVFKQVTSVTPHQYILRARLREAAVQLKNRLEPVLGIALDAGFRDLANFNHVFRAQFGVSPSAYRKQPGV